jgi:hypothetical protein
MNMIMINFSNFSSIFVSLMSTLQSRIRYAQYSHQLLFRQSSEHVPVQPPSARSHIPKIDKHEEDSRLENSSRHQAPIAKGQSHFRSKSVAFSLPFHAPTPLLLLPCQNKQKKSPDLGKSHREEAKESPEAEDSIAHYRI